MKRNTISLKTRLYVAAAMILLVGLSNAAFIYLTARNVSENELIDQLENSKRYRHDLELMGGKANVIADDLVHWFNGLWHGKSLAFTVASLTVLLASGLSFAAHQWPGDSPVEGDNHQSASG